MRTWWVLSAISWVSFAVACSSAPPTPVPVAVVAAPVPPDAAGADVQADAAVPDAAPADAAVVVVTPARLENEVLGKVPAVAGPVTRIEEDKTVTVGGVKITMLRANHKHAVGGRAMGMWSFKLGAKAIELRSWEERFEAEVVGNGVFFVFRHVSYGSFDIVLAGKRAPKPLTEEKCEALIETKAKEASLPTGGSSSSSESEGIIRHQEAGWVGHCGRYSKRVWFTRARPGDD